MKYIEKRYTEPNENGVIGLVFLPVEEPEAPKEQPAEEIPAEPAAKKKKSAQA